MPPLWAKALWPTNGWLVRKLHVGRLVDEARQLGEVLERRAAEHLVALLLEGQVGDHGDQVGVAAALAEAVDRALHLHGAGVDGGQRVGDGQLAVVVAVDADRHVDSSAAAALRQLGDFLRHAAAVGVAEHDQLAPASAAAWIVLRGVFGIGLPAVEEMLGVVDHLAALARAGNATLSAIIARFSSSETRSTSVT